jgi:hypothetical protein
MGFILPSKKRGSITGSDACCKIAALAGISGNRFLED